jgi:hypothetical protein
MAQQALHVRGRERAQGSGLELLDLLRAVGAELGVLDLVVELEDRVHEHLGARRAAGQVDVDGHDVVDALHDRVVVEHAAGAGAHAHRDDPLRLGHLVVDLPDDRRHLLRDAAGHDHQVGLARRGPEDLHAEAREVVAAGAGRHHLDGAAGETEGRGPQAGLAAPVDDLLDGGQDDAAGELFLDTHGSSPTPIRRGARRRRTRRTPSR